jgi:hypothetical protein
MQQCAGPGTPNAAPKQSTGILTCYFASVINLGAAFLTHAIESPQRPVPPAGEGPQPLPAKHP